MAGMGRKLSVQYPEAIYHVMNCGDSPNRTGMP